MQNSTAVDEALHRELGVESPRFLGQLLPQVVELVRTCRRLPVGEEYAIRRGSTEFLQGSRELGDRSLGLAHAALRFLDPSAHRDTSAKDLDNFNLLVDSIDSVLERVDDCLKEALTEPAAPEAAATDQGAAPSEASAGRGGNKYVEAGRHLAKPQARWRQLVDNGRTEFVPRIVEKHNQLVPLPPELLEAQRRAGLREGGAGGAGSTPGGRPAPAEAASAEASALGALESHLSAMGVGRQKGAHPQLPHPYEAELAALEVPNGVLELRKPVIYERMEDTPLVLVETGDELRAMVEEIKATCSGGEIAVDVEHHDFRSYRGFVCLVQISTRRKDFILDPFGMFSEMHMLNEIQLRSKRTLWQKQNGRRIS
ncbi:unnamed protein product [Prorocentrum cordatum]|uniref:Uncharacterized protein n=1 Tax=Prorocentrum cordatum TaxID=2364126 RepID=A0ABN9VBN3_9DINO|nr:unnamed protein product [Polarella glacialis]